MAFPGAQGATSGMTDPMTTRGDTIIRNSSNTTARLAVGAANTVVASDGTDTAFRTLAAVGAVATSRAVNTSTGLSGGGALSGDLTLTIGQTYIPSATQGFRLTLTTAVPVTTADVTGATTLYFTPYKSDRIALYDGTNWSVIESAEVSLTLASLSPNTNYDVFVYSNSGTLTIDTLTAWTNDTTRATALALTDGVWLKTGALTRRYVGSIRMVSASETEDSLDARFVWNYDNRVRKMLEKEESTASWQYTTATLRPGNNATTNRVEVVRGLNEDPVEVTVAVRCENSSAGVGVEVAVGVDSTTTSSNNHTEILDIPSAGDALNVRGTYVGMPALGYHYFQWLEWSQATGTTTWYGSSSNGGLYGFTWC